MPYYRLVIVSLHEIVFDPNPNNDNSKNYNCFKGFNHDEEIEPVLEENSKFKFLQKKYVWKTPSMNTLNNG